MYNVPGMNPMGMGIGMNGMGGMPMGYVPQMSNPMNMGNQIYNNPSPTTNALSKKEKTLQRLKKEFQLCSNTKDLVTLGCSFGLEDNNYFIWRVSMMGPQNTPYDGGCFQIRIIFPENYPEKGPEFRFVNKIYHLNVDFKTEDPKKMGHICLNKINQWTTTGKVTGNKHYNVKQALFDIFCLFYDQGIGSPYDEQAALDYQKNPEKFNAIAREWTQKYAKL